MQRRTLESEIHNNAEKLQELLIELQNQKIDYGNQNKRRKLVEILDKELTHETLENKGNYIYLQ